MAAKAARRCVVAGRQLKRNKKAKKLLVRQKKGPETFINVSGPLINLKYLNSKIT